MIVKFSLKISICLGSRLKLPTYTGKGSTTDFATMYTTIKVSKDTSLYLTPGNHAARTSFRPKLQLHYSIVLQLPMMSALH